MNIRKARLEDAVSIAQVHVASWRTTYAGILPSDFLAGLSVEKRTEFWRGVLVNPQESNCLYVAENEWGEIFGFVAAGPERTQYPGYTSELYAIYLLQAAQGQGLGRRLVKAAVEYLVEHHYISMLVWVLADNPSRKFYEALGGVKIAEKPIVIGEMAVLETAYGWQDSNQILIDFR